MKEIARKQQQKKRARHKLISWARALENWNYVAAQIALNVRLLCIKTERDYRWQERRASGGAQKERHLNEHVNLIVDGINSIRQRNTSPSMRTKGIAVSYVPILSDPISTIPIGGGTSKCNGLTCAHTAFRVWWNKRSIEVFQEAKVERKIKHTECNGIIRPHHWFVFFFFFLFWCRFFPRLSTKCFFFVEQMQRFENIACSQSRKWTVERQNDIIRSNCISYCDTLVRSWSMQLQNWIDVPQLIISGVHTIHCSIT